MAARSRRSAGLLMYRIRDRRAEVFLAHPGGPFWAHKDAGVWGIPKGEIGAGEEALEAARREFTEETGLVSEGPFLPLEPVQQKSGKVVQAWYFCGDCAPESIRSNNFEMEWPPRSGTLRTFPEVDRAAFFALPEARIKILPGQAALLDELERALRVAGTID